MKNEEAGSSLAPFYVFRSSFFVPFRSLLRSKFLRSSFLSAAIALSWGLVGAGQVPTQLPLEPLRDAGLSITGAFEGWFQNADGTFALLVGYYNRNQKQTLDIPVGPNNRIEPGGPDQGQPTHFLPKRQWGVFAIIVPKDFGDKRLVWTLTANRQTTSVPLHLNPLWVVEPYKDAAQGNTPPVARFQPGGKIFQGPPLGVAAEFTTRIPDPVTLSLWVTDDMKRPPEARPRPGPPISVTWSKHRGPGAVTFGNPKPDVDAADGKTTTTATFSEPGDYTLRAQVNDTSGDGGGGFQCCWTTVHVRVVVAPASQ